MRVAVGERENDGQCPHDLTEIRQPQSGLLFSQLQIVRDWAPYLEADCQDSFEEM